VTPREQGLRDAEKASEAILHRFGVRKSTHIKIEAFASAFGLTIVDGQLDGARARLTRGKKPQIRVSVRTPSEEARRFSIAHEMGHHVLDHFGDKPHAVCTGTTAQRRSFQTSKRDFESEAQVFAAGVLMPRSLVAPRCVIDEPSLDVPQLIAKDFGTSLPASTIRFVELTPSRCAAVHSVNGVISWAVRSPTFTVKIPRGKKLDGESVAATRYESGAPADRPTTLSAKIWLGNAGDVEIVEHSLPVSEGGVISLIWVPESSAKSLGMTAR
jgi:Zn-dependent peptidase ImmA (M78 family)